MSKSIVICLDGTWNKPSKKEHHENNETNVRNLFELLNSANHPQQHCYYDAGVGSKSGNKLWGGITGRGLSLNIRQAYREICEHYQNGDKIYLFGFSRGAYSARSLAGMIHACGLIDREKLTQPALKRIWDDYKSNDPQRQSRRKRRQIKVSIEVLGVWDTVGALGIPISWFQTLNDEKYKFHDTSLSPSIKRAYHALAIDEQRAIFTPTLWDEKARVSHQTIEQIWFAGVHSDVGGGYMERHLSDISLAWMIDRLSNDLVFDLSNYLFTSDISSPPHDSYRVYFGKRVPRKMLSTTSSIHCSVKHKIRIDPEYLHQKHPLKAIVDDIEWTKFGKLESQLYQIS